MGAFLHSAGTAPNSKLAFPSKVAYFLHSEVQRTVRPPWHVWACKFYCLRQGTWKRGEGRPRLVNCISGLCPRPLGSPPAPNTQIG